IVDGEPGPTSPRRRATRFSPGTGERRSRIAADLVVAVRAVRGAVALPLERDLVAGVALEDRTPGLVGSVGAVVLEVAEPGVGDVLARAAGEGAGAATDELDLGGDGRDRRRTLARAGEEKVASVEGVGIVAAEGGEAAPEVGGDRPQALEVGGHRRFPGDDLAAALAEAGGDPLVGEAGVDARVLADSDRAGAVAREA